MAIALNTNLSAAQNMNQHLEKAISAFCAEYSLSFRHLMQSLDEAHISHYSSGCDNRHITYEIFPASGYVAEMLRMVSLERSHKPKNSSSLRDAIARVEYNPAIDFVHYLRRWSLFAEQVMRAQGPSPRGVAAARAKLMMDRLIENLSEGKSGIQLKQTAFARLMAEISVELEAREKQQTDHVRTSQSQQDQANYHAALRAAGGAQYSSRDQLAVV